MRSNITGDLNLHHLCCENFKRHTIIKFLSNKIISLQMLLNFISKGSYLHLHFLYFIHYINLRMFFLNINVQELHSMKYSCTFPPLII